MEHSVTTSAMRHSTVSQLPCGVASCGVAHAVSWRNLCVCPRETSVCVPEKPPYVSRRNLRVRPGETSECVLLVGAYQCRQLSAQLASPSCLEQDVIVRGFYIGVCR